MKLAINYSPAAGALARDGMLPVDLFKCPSPFDRDVSVHMPDLLNRAREIRPVYVHFPLFAGKGGLRDVDWTEIEGVLAATATPYVNLHLETRSGDFPNIPTDTTDPKHQETIAEALISDVMLAVRRLGPERVIVENVVARGSVLRPWRRAGGDHARRARDRVRPPAGHSARATDRRGTGARPIPVSNGFTD